MNKAFGTCNVRRWTRFQKATKLHVSAKLEFLDSF